MIVIGIIVFAIGIVIAVAGSFLEETTQTGAYLISLLPIIGGLVVFIQGLRS